MPDYSFRESRSDRHRRLCNGWHRLELICVVVLLAFIALFLYTSGTTSSAFSGSDDVDSGKIQRLQGFRRNSSLRLFPNGNLQAVRLSPCYLHSRPPLEGSFSGWYSVSGLDSENPHLLRNFFFTFRAVSGSSILIISIYPVADIYKKSYLFHN